MRMALFGASRPRADVHGGPERWRAAPSVGLRGRVTIPGDKSISHRALILAALARGDSEIEGLLESEDVLRTVVAVERFGASTLRAGQGRWRVRGLGGLSEPDAVIDCGNSGTAARLLMGAVAGFAITATFAGDASLSSRPMLRVLHPLSRMGVDWLARREGRLPVALRGGELNGIDHRPEQASAQVKSAVLLAGLNARGSTRVIEARPTRDHTERMMRAMGADLEVVESHQGLEATIAGGGALRGGRIEVPGDPSSAAFPMVAALITPGSKVWLDGVLLNARRCGLIETLREMGAEISIQRRPPSGGEEVGDISVGCSALKGVVVPTDRIASMIDELPVLAVAAAFARGPTVVRQAAELRVKESDRIASVVSLLHAMGAAVEEHADGFTIAGRRAGEPPPPGGGQVRSFGDHRIAMAALVMGLATREPVEIDDGSVIATSFPDFGALMRELGADIGPLATQGG